MPNHFQVEHTSTPMLDCSVGYAADPLEGLLRKLRSENPRPSVVGVPPQSLASLHEPQFVDTFWQRVEAALRHPVTVHLSEGIRRVSVLGLGVYEYFPDGTMKTAIWQCRSDEPPLLETADPRTISVTGTPFGRSWPNLFREGFCLSTPGENCTEVAAEICTH